MAEEIGKFSLEHVSTTYTEDAEGNISTHTNWRGEAEGYEVRSLSGITEDPKVNYNGLNTQIALRGLEKDGIIHRTKRNTRQVTWFITKKKRII